MVYPHSFTTSSKGILNCSPLTLVLNLDSLSYTQASVTRLYSNADAPGCSGLIAPRPSAVLSCHLWNQFDSRVGFTCSKHPLADLIIFRDQKVSVICGPTYRRLGWGWLLLQRAAYPRRRRSDWKYFHLRKNSGGSRELIEKRNVGAEEIQSVKGLQHKCENLALRSPATMQKPSMVWRCL